MLPIRMTRHARQRAAEWAKEFRIYPHQYAEMIDQAYLVRPSGPNATAYHCGSVTFIVSNDDRSLVTIVKNSKERWEHAPT